MQKDKVNEEVKKRFTHGLNSADDQRRKAAEAEEEEWARYRIPEVRNIVFTIYDKVTGKILSNGTAATPRSLNRRLQPGQAWIAEHADGRLFKIVKGRPVPRKDPEPIEVPTDMLAMADSRMPEMIPELLARIESAKK